MRRFPLPRPVIATCPSQAPDGTGPAGRPHRCAWRMRPAARTPASPDTQRTAPCLPPMTGCHHITVPDEATRDQLLHLLVGWRRAAAQQGESLVQFARRRMFGASAAVNVGLPPPEAPAAEVCRRATFDEVAAIAQPMVRIVLFAPDTLDDMGQLMSDWTRLAGGSAESFLHIGRQCLLGQPGDEPVRRMPAAGLVKHPIQ